MSKITDAKVTRASNALRKHKKLLDNGHYSEAFNAIDPNMVVDIPPTGYNDKGEAFWSFPQMDGLLNKFSPYFGVR